ncbi:MAG: PEP-CTERM/exosortase system-associated acyltransferase [Candidatus Omnitrophota bacterium]
MSEPFTFRKIEVPELLEEAYRLRFQVYCKECNFFRESDCPEGYETDEYDQDSIHLGAFDSQGILVGAVRLILPSCEKFPIEKYCPVLNLNIDIAGRKEYAEISRLAISKLHRRRMIDEFSSEPQIIENSSLCIRRVSSIAMGLCCLLHEECSNAGIKYCLALMERPLSLLLKLHGFVFQTIGPEIDFYGKVAPYLLDVVENEKKGLFRITESYPHGREIHLQKDRFS